VVRHNSPWLRAQRVHVPLVFNKAATSSYLNAASIKNHQQYYRLLPLPSEPPRCLKRHSSFSHSSRKSYEPSSGRNVCLVASWSWTSQLHASTKRIATCRPCQDGMPECLSSATYAENLVRLFKEKVGFYWTTSEKSTKIQIERHGVHQTIFRTNGSVWRQTLYTYTSTTPMTISNGHSGDALMQLNTSENAPSLQEAHPSQPMFSAHSMSHAMTYGGSGTISFWSV